MTGKWLVGHVGYWGFCKKVSKIRHEDGTFYFSLVGETSVQYSRNIPRTPRASVGGLCYHVIERDPLWERRMRAANRAAPQARSQPPACDRPRNDPEN